MKRTIDEKLDVLTDQVLLLTGKLALLEKNFADFKKFIGTEDQLQGVIRIINKEKVK